MTGPVIRITDEEHPALVVGEQQYRDQPQPIGHAAGFVEEQVVGMLALELGDRLVRATLGGVFRLATESYALVTDVPLRGIGTALQLALGVRPFDRSPEGELYLVERRG